MDFIGSFIQESQCQPLDLQQKLEVTLSNNEDRCPLQILLACVLVYQDDVPP